MPQDTAPYTTETDQVDDILDTFYIDSEDDSLDVMEQEDVDLYNLYGDGSVTPYTRPSSPQQGISQTEVPGSDETNNSEKDTPRPTDDSTEGKTDEAEHAQRHGDEENKGFAELEDKDRKHETPL